MSIEFRNVSAPPLNAFSVMAPSGVIIGVIGEKNSGVTELLKLAGGVAQPESGEITAPPERRFVGLGETLNLAPAAVIALDQAAGHAGRDRAGAIAHRTGPAAALRVDGAARVA